MGSGPFYMTDIHSERRIPPTAVGGIVMGLRVLLCRKDLNEPPTAVGGISTFVQSPDHLGLCYKTFTLDLTTQVCFARSSI